MELTRRKGGGSGGGHSGGGHSGGGSRSGVSRGGTSHGLPKGHEKVTTYGKGEGSPIKEKSGPLKGWNFGGRRREDVYGNSFHPIAPAPRTLPWGFIPIVTLLEPGTSVKDSANLHYYQSLPQNITRPGGEVVEMVIASSANSTALPFFFISDMYSVGEVKTSITTNCTDVVVSDPIPFNIQLGSVVQYYRGETAEIVLSGY